MKKIPSKQCRASGCSNKFLQYKSTQIVCSVQCAVLMAKEKNQKAQLTKARVAKKKFYDENITVQKLANKVQDEYFNPWVRRRDLGKSCISCPKILSGKFDAGHFWPKTKSSIRFDEANVHGQCVKCNQFLHSNPHEYRVKILTRISPEELERLDSMAHDTRHWTRYELRELMKRYPIPSKSKKN